LFSSLERSDNQACVTGSAKLTQPGFREKLRFLAWRIYSIRAQLSLRGNFSLLVSWERASLPHSNARHKQILKLLFVPNHFKILSSAPDPIRLVNLKVPLRFRPLKNLRASFRPSNNLRSSAPVA